MRILHVVPSYIPAFRYGGPIKSVHGLCKGLAELGHDVHVFTTNVNGPGDSDVPLGVPVDIDGVKVWYFPSKRLRRLYWSPQMAGALARQVAGFDLVHLHSLYLWPTTAAARAARRSHVPYVVAPRGMLIKDIIRMKSRWIKTAWIALFERSNLEQAAAIHYTSKLELDEALKFNFSLPSEIMVPNGIELEESDESAEASGEVTNYSTRGKYILFLSRISWKKGLDRLIPALAYLPGYNLLITGNDDENYLPVVNELAAQYSVADRVICTGPVYGRDKFYLLENAAAFVLPSYGENFGNVVLEAMAVGCPVVVTPEVGAAYIVRDYGAGLVIDGDPATLGAGLQTLLENPEECARMGQRGRRAVEDHFTWGAVARQMEQAYQRITGAAKQ